MSLVVLGGCVVWVCSALYRALPSGFRRAGTARFPKEFSRVLSGKKTTHARAPSDSGYSSYTKPWFIASAPTTTTTTAAHHPMPAAECPKITSTNGGEAPKVPTLPQVAANILPLGTLLQNFAEYAFSEISHLVATLPNLQQPDAVKKKQLLELFVRLRKDLVKLYVLVKWSARATDFQKLIQLMSFMRGEQGHLFNSVWGMKSIVPGLASAKLPNPDLMTALEVFINGRPQLPSHNLIRQPPLLPTTILKTFRNLNVLLAIKLALADDLPTRFRNYQIRDGRVTFTVEHEFVASVSIADDETQAASTSPAPFFLIDFKFLFGFPDDEYVIDDGLVTVLPLSNRAKLENLANSVLRTGGLAGLYTVLHHYAITYKLYLVHKQLSNMRQSGVWKGHLQHTYNSDQSTIVVTYWAARAALRSFLEIGINNRFELAFRWFREGKYVAMIPLSIRETAPNPYDMPLSESGLCIELTLAHVTQKHAEATALEIYQQMASQLSARKGLTPSATLVSILSAGRIHYQLTHTQHTVIGIDSITGNVFLLNPTPLMASFVARANADASTAAKVAHHLLVMRLEILTLKLSSVLSAVGWIRNDVVKISSTSEDWARLKFNTNGALNVRYFRRKEWPQGWFLICGVNGYSSNISWRVAQVWAALGSWQIQWIDLINLLADTQGEEESGVVVCEPKNYKSYFDYEVLSELALVSANKITSHLILEELKSKGCRLMSLRTPLFFAAEDPTAVYGKAFMDIIQASGSEKGESIIVIDKQSLIPAPGCYNTLFLRIKLVGQYLRLSLYGKLQSLINIRVDGLQETGGCYVLFDNDTGIFEIQHKVETLSLTTPSVSGTLLSQTLHRLTTLLNLISILNVLRESKVEIILTQLDAIRFRYDTEEAALCGFMGDAVRLELYGANPHHFVAAQLDTLLQTDGIPHLIQTLKETLPLVRALRETLDANTTAMTATEALSGEYGFPRVRFKLFTGELNYFQLRYTKYTVVPASPETIVPFDPHSGEAVLRNLEMVELTVRLRVGYRGKTYLYVTANPQTTFLREFWSFTPKKSPFRVEQPESLDLVQTGTPVEIYSLDTGLACAVTCASAVLRVLNREIMTRLGVDV